MTIPIHKRKRHIPLPKAKKEAPPRKPIRSEESRQQEHPLLLKPMQDLTSRELRKLELYEKYDRQILLDDIYVDPINGVELYRNTVSNGWVTNPAYRHM